MKPHLIIKLKDQPDNPKFDYWESLISDKSNLSTRFIPSVDAILNDKYKYDFIASQNYKSKNKDWSSDELKAGLNRIYRLILLTNNKEIPKEMVDEISLIPHISYINTGQIISSTIPKQTYASSQSLSSRYPNHSIYLKEAHQWITGHPEIKIAVLDTGIETSHSEFNEGSSNRSPKFAGDKDFVNIIDGAQQFVGDYLDMDEIPDDKVGHGTHVAGIRGSYGNKMAVGVAP
ncbi:S8 family serine peptidase, partial [uncultured Eudoraea sp.]|uniref:S8 family serine peptidase n=1 Tax=uncultured Eudoraea sp. TaxID=1035614 RepID=UPI00261C9107